MSYNAIFVNLDQQARLEYLLGRLRDRELTKKEALELKPLLEQIWLRALELNDANTARKISDMLIGLNGYIHCSSEFRDYINLSNVL